MLEEAGNDCAGGVFDWMRYICPSFPHRLGLLADFAAVCEALANALVEIGYVDVDNPDGRLAGVSAERMTDAGHGLVGAGRIHAVVLMVSHIDRRGRPAGDLLVEVANGLGVRDGEISVHSMWPTFSMGVSVPRALRRIQKRKLTHGQCYRCPT